MCFSRFASEKLGWWWSMRDESHQVLVQAVGEMEEGGL